MTIQIEDEEQPQVCREERRESRSYGELGTRATCRSVRDRVFAALRDRRVVAGR